MRVADPALYHGRKVADNLNLVAHGWGHASGLLKEKQASGGCRPLMYCREKVLLCADKRSKIRLSFLLKSKGRKCIPRKTLINHLR